MTKIAIWALDGGLSSTIAGTIDVFHLANLLWKNRHPDTNASPFQWQLASPSGQPIRTDSGVMISVDAAIDASVDVDIVLVPGIVATTATEIEAAIDHNALLVASLRKQRERGATIAANCASTFFLAESNESSARAAGVEPLGRLVAYAHAAVDPKVMGLGPIPAVERVLARAKLSLSDIDVIECNEASLRRLVLCRRCLILTRHASILTVARLHWAIQSARRAQFWQSNCLYELQSALAGVTVSSRCALVAVKGSQPYLHASELTDERTDCDEWSRDDSTAARHEKVMIASTIDPRCWQPLRVASCAACSQTSWSKRARL